MSNDAMSSDAAKSAVVAGTDPERDAFESVVKQWTGKDMDYHHANGTTGLEFAWFCWQTGAARGNKAKSPDPRNDAYDMIDRHLRNTLGDSDYATFSVALDVLFAK